MNVRFLRAVSGAVGVKGLNKKSKIKSIFFFHKKSTSKYSTDPYEFILPV